MAMEITNNYGAYATQGMADSSAANSTKKKGTGKTKETAGNPKPQNTAGYADELQKLVPSAELRVGNSFATDKDGITLTVNPNLLEEMQNDPEKEKEMKELIKGVESAVNMLDSVCKGSGWTVVFKHCYIDENGKFCSIALLRNDYMLNLSKELREERRENSEKLIEKNKEKAAEKKEALKEALEEKSDSNKGEQILEEKIAASKDGMIYLYDTDLKTIMEVAKEGREKKPVEKERAQAGANLDLRI